MKKRKKTISEGVSQSRAILHLLNGNTKNRKLAYFKLKQNLKFSDLCNAADFLTNNLHTSRTELILGNPLPKNYSELGLLNEMPILGLWSDGELISVDLTSELNSVLIGIRKYKFQINLFLRYKEAYERYLLIGDYVNAELQLTKIETEICYSLWSLENRFVLKEVILT